MHVHVHVHTSSSGSTILAIACDTGSSSEDLGKTSVLERGESTGGRGESSVFAVQAGRQGGGKEGGKEGGREGGRKGGREGGRAGGGRKSKKRDQEHNSLVYALYVLICSD